MSNFPKDIDVFILCGGRGKRLHKISPQVPKPMVKIGNYSFLDILIKHMSNFGFKRFILGTGYKADVIKQYYRRNCIPGIEILFSREKSLLGTGGAVKNAARLIRSNPFIILNGDSFCQLNPLNFLKFHKEKKSLISILLKKIHNGQEYGEVKIDKFSRIQNFREKNKRAKKCLINAGVYIFKKEVFSLMNFASKFSLEYDFFPRVVNKINIYGYRTPGLFIDIGTPARYTKAKKIFLKSSQK